jgi:hypothetical protein
VVAVEGDLLVVEEGKLRKARYAIPKAHYGLTRG